MAISYQGNEVKRHYSLLLGEAWNEALVLDRKIQEYTSQLDREMEGWMKNVMDKNSNTMSQIRKLKQLRSGGTSAGLSWHFFITLNSSKEYMEEGNLKFKMILEKPEDLCFGEDRNISMPFFL